MRRESHHDCSVFARAIAQALFDFGRVAMRADAVGFEIIFQFGEVKINPETAAPRALRAAGRINDQIAGVD